MQHQQIAQTVVFLGCQPVVFGAIRRTGSADGKMRQQPRDAGLRQMQRRAFERVDAISGQEKRSCEPRTRADDRAPAAHNAGVPRESAANLG